MEVDQKQAVSRPANSFPSQTPTSLGTDITSFTVNVQLLAEPNRTRLASAKVDPKWAALLPRSTTIISISCFRAQTVHAKFQEGFILGKFVSRDVMISSIDSQVTSNKQIYFLKLAISSPCSLSVDMSRRGSESFDGLKYPYYSSSIVQVHHPRPFLP
jgi:hypothetical protein